MSIVGGFVPALLYRPDRIEAELEYVVRASRQLAATGSKVLVLGPSSHHDGYDTRIDMSDDEWTIFLANLRRAPGDRRTMPGSRRLCILTGPWRSRTAATSSDCSTSSDVGLCIDTGHLYLAGTDPVDVARMATGRVLHVHLKDVDRALAEARAQRRGPRSGRR